jgi:hypothetical protein
MGRPPSPVRVASPSRGRPSGVVGNWETRAEQHNQRAAPEHDAVSHGAVPIHARDIGADGFRDGSRVTRAIPSIVERIENDESITVVFCTEPSAPYLAPFRTLCLEILKRVGTHYVTRVLNGLRLLEYLSPGLAASLTIYCNDKRVNPAQARVASLRLRCCCFTVEPPKKDPLVETLNILSTPERARLMLLLDVCRTAASVDLPIRTSEDQLKVERIAEALSTSEERLLADWGRVGLHGATPQTRWAEALFLQTFEWCLGLVNRQFKQIREEPRTGAQVTIMQSPPFEGTSFYGFATFVAAEAISQRVVELLPSVDLDRTSRSACPSVEEAPVFKDTVFSLASAGIFGQAGLLHFLTSGHRTSSAISTYVELLRDGDLGMRRYFGARQRDVLRIKAGDTMASFDLPSLARSTDFDSYEIFDLGGDKPRWLEHAKVRIDGAVVPARENHFTDQNFIPLQEQVAVKRSTPIVRVVNGINDLLRVVRGELFMMHVHSEHNPKPPLSLPSPVRLLQVWRDQVPYKKLKDFVEYYGFGVDPIMISDKVLGPGQVEVVGDLCVFKPNKGAALWRTLMKEMVTEGLDTMGVGKYWHAWCVTEGKQEVPREWRSPRKAASYFAADFQKTLPASPPVRPRGSREGPDHVREALEHAPHRLRKHFHGVFPDIDSRYKETGKEDHDASRLLFNTSVLMCSNGLFNRGIVRAELAHEAYKLGEAESALQRDKEPAALRERMFGYDPNVRSFDAGPKWWQDVAHRVDNHVIGKLDQFRAVFRGKQQRKAMARLQRSHLAAEKIQLAFAVFMRLRNAASQCIQTFVRARKLRQILRNNREARWMIRDAERRKMKPKLGERKPIPEGAIPIWIPGSCPRDGLTQVRGEICRVVTAWCGLPPPLRTDPGHKTSDEIIRVSKIDTSNDRTTLYLDAPQVLKEKIEMLQATVGLPASPLERVQRLIELLQKQKRHVGRQEGQLNKPREATKFGLGKISNELGKAKKLDPDALLYPLSQWDPTHGETQTTRHGVPVQKMGGDVLQKGTYGERRPDSPSPGSPGSPGSPSQAFSPPARKGVQA